MADYARSQLAATDLLLRQQITGLAVEPVRLAYDRNIRFDTLQGYCAATGARLSDFVCGDEALRDGCTLRYGEFYLVLANSHGVANYKRRKFTLAHEVGHIYLGHTWHGPEEEKEANWFASQLLMPECVLMEIWRRDGKLLAQDVAGWFFVSDAAAHNRVRQLQRARRYRFGAAEKQLVQRYLPHILAALRDPYPVSV